MQEKNFVLYEYKTKKVNVKDQTRVIDMYESFGWEVAAVTPMAFDAITLSLKRDRKQKHTQELIKLEWQAEEIFFTIKVLKKAKTRNASIFSYILGCISVLIFGGGLCLTMLFDNSMPALVGGIILGLIGIALCGINYLIYKKLEEKKTLQILPIIDDNEEKLANVLEKGNDLLSADFI